MCDVTHIFIGNSKSFFIDLSVEEIECLIVVEESPIPVIFMLCFFLVSRSFCDKLSVMRLTCEQESSRALAGIYTPLALRIKTTAVASLTCSTDDFLKCEWLTAKLALERLVSCWSDMIVLGICDC